MWDRALKEMDNAFDEAKYGLQRGDRRKGRKEEVKWEEEGAPSSHDVSDLTLLFGGQRKQTLDLEIY
jgi:hypothetical protein